MKKRYLLLIILFFTICLTGCSDNSNITKATITKSDDEIIQKSASELVTIYEENELNFKNEYEDKEISITEEFDSISTAGNVTCVYLKNNWVIAYHENKGMFLDIAAKLKKGDKVTFKGKIHGIGGYCDWNHKMVEMDVPNGFTFDITN